MFQNETSFPRVPRLMVIADDVTGAFDTGVQFSKRGAEVRMLNTRPLPSECPSADVVVIDAETRHLSAKEAYDITCELTCQALAWQIPYLYMKVDSGLRGNVGPVLKAALDATGSAMLAFAPAYPAMDRVTRGGSQWVGGVALRDSVFGRDLFEPVVSQGIREMLEPSGARVTEVGRNKMPDVDPQAPAIALFDAETDEDLQAIASGLAARDQLHVAAGCAAFAAALVPHLQLPNRVAGIKKPVGQLLVLCGSLNPITRTQMEFGEQLGFARITLPLTQLLAEEPFTTADGAALLERIVRLMANARPLMLDTGLCTPTDLTDYGTLPMNVARERIANALGRLLAQLLARPESKRYIPMIIGGDTLMAVIRCLDHPSITLQGEMDTGVVIFSAEAWGRNVQMLSKSGGLGSKTLLCDVVSNEICVR